MRKKQWSCDSVVREPHAVSDLELRQRLAETFELLVKDNGQQQIALPAFSKDPLSLSFEAPKHLGQKPEKKGA